MSAVAAVLGMPAKMGNSEKPISCPFRSIAREKAQSLADQTGEAAFVYTRSDYELYLIATSSAFSRSLGRGRVDVQVLHVATPKH